MSERNLLYNRLPKEDPRDEWAPAIPIPVIRGRRGGGGSTRRTEQAEIGRDKAAFQDAINFFGDVILSLLCSEKWFESVTLFHPPSFIGKKLNIALARLLYTAQDKIDINDASTEDKNSLSQFTASRFLRQLANYICINAPKIYSTQTEQKNATVLPVPKPFPQEVLRTVQSLGMCSDLDGVSRLQDEDRRSSHESDTAGLVDSVDAGLLLSKSPSFSTFCFTLRQDLYDKASPILTHIEAIVRKSITPAFNETQNLELNMFLSHEGSLSFKVSAPLSDLIELAQQIVWICSALRVGQTNNTSHAYRRDVYHPIYEVSESYMKGNATFHVSCQSESTTWKQDSCWREVVAPTAVLCQHFPIPQRRDEVGLEIPLGMFCAMAGMRHAVEFEGGIVMKSVDGMLIPVSRKDNIVQWHFVSGDDDGERFKYQHGISKCPNRALIDTVDFETLETTRAIVGWCRRARKVVGREIAAYHGIDYSGTKAFSSGIRYSGTSFGFQQFGTAQLNFTMGPKDTRVVFQRSGTFTKILRWAGESHVLLQDTVDKRAWLVNADGVILHVIQTRSYRDQTHNQETNESLDHLEYANTASETLANHENWKFPTSSDTVSDMAFEIWSKLEMLLDQATALNKTPDRRVRIPFQKELVGFEFMGIVKEKSPLDIKRYTLENDSGGWARLIKDTATLVLSAQGFRDLIEPESCNQEDCSAWQKMPKGRDYLGTTVPILMDFYAMAGSSSDLKRLTSSGLYWCSQNTA
ncbi:hypothetical protein ACLX1H_009057 [Fusarium chlamydosporum]